MSLTEILKRHMDVEDVNDVCISIELEDGILPFAFIREELDGCLVVDNTDEMGYEKIVIVPKKSIVTVSVVYQQDIDSVFETDEFDEKVKRLYQ